MTYTEAEVARNRAALRDYARAVNPPVITFDQFATAFTLTTETTDGVVHPSVERSSTGYIIRIALVSGGVGRVETNPGGVVTAATHGMDSVCLGVRIKGLGAAAQQVRDVPEES